MMTLDVETLVKANELMELMQSKKFRHLAKLALDFIKRCLAQLELLHQVKSIPGRTNEMGLTDGLIRFYRFRQ
jgi:methionine-gamma-lyase